MRLLTRLLVLPLLLALAGCFVLLGSPAPAHAATKHAGIPDLTPYGGYLGNYLAPDGSRVYCIDSPLEWPSGETSGPSAVDSLVTTWGAELPAAALRKLNYVLLGYGQTDDPVQAAAVAAFVNAYTSGWARDLGAGYAAGAWYLNGNATVTGVYDAIWADAEAHGDPAGSAALQLDMATPTEGSLTVTASPSGATGTVVLAGAVRADTGESEFAVGDHEVVPLRGLPADDAREYTVSAEGRFTVTIPAGASLLLYTTGGQQRTIRGDGPGSLEFSAAARTSSIPLDFSPVITTEVETRSVEVGEPLVDRLRVALAEGSRPWRTGADGAPVDVVADGVLYGPFAEPPAEAPSAPADAPVAGREAVTLSGTGEYSTSGSVIADEPGYYTWVWTVDAARQDAVGAAALPPGYLFVSPFGLQEETHWVSAPAPRLAATGSTSAGLQAGAGVGGSALVVGGALLALSRRGRAGILTARGRWGLRE
jgi:hypothetical protein